jgi:hypothetical protein
MAHGFDIYMNAEKWSVHTNELNAVGHADGKYDVGYSLSGFLMNPRRIRLSVVFIQFGDMYNTVAHIGHACFFKYLPQQSVVIIVTAVVDIYNRERDWSIILPQLGLIARLNVVARSSVVAQ